MPIHRDACIKFTVPGEAARIYFETERHLRPNIQNLFPDLRIEHREILINGTSPAEFDRNRGKRMPKTHEAFVAKYSPLGYTFENA